MPARVIRILYFEGCPNHPPTVAMVRRVVRDMGVDAFVEETELRRPEEAAPLRFLGSPTVQVDGADVEPSARTRTDYGFGCRMYDGAGVPPEDLLRAALAGREVRLAEQPIPACCRDASRDQQPRAAWTLAGAVASAAASSACCWLPVALAAAGASVAGLSTVLDRWRPAFAALAVGMLIYGFYGSYFGARACCVDAVGRRALRIRRAGVWCAGALVAGFLLYPSYAPALGLA